mgnify:CR=1 FL=1
MPIHVLTGDGDKKRIANHLARIDRRFGNDRGCFGHPDRRDGFKAAPASVAKMKEYGIVDSGDTLRDGIGAMDDDRVASFFDKMVRAGVVRRDIDFRQAYTLRFVNKGVGLDLRPKN